MSNSPSNSPSIFSSLEESCARMYEPGVKFVNENNKCGDIAKDAEFIKRKSNIERRTFTCNIPNWNTTSKIHTYWNIETNGICPVGGWCGANYNNVNADIVQNVDGDLTNKNSEITDGRYMLFKSGNDVVGKPLCPLNIFKSTLNVPQECPSLLAYNYKNDDCASIEKDDEVVKKFCFLNEDGTVMWNIDKDDDGNDRKFCNNRNKPNTVSRLYQNVNNTLTCNNGEDKIPVVAPVYKIFDSARWIECPSGYCLNDNGELNMKYIDQYVAQTDKHPFCPDSQLY
jgi:hypothetical protein